MSFTVQAEPPPVNGVYRTGKQALENRRRELVTCKDPRRLTGSINPDSVLARQPDHANATRWDYGLGYRPTRKGREQAIWIEVHSATTGEVSAVLRKLQWLQDWSNNRAGCLKRMTDHADSNNRFVWIASVGVNISPNSPQARRLSQSAIRRSRKQL